MNVGDCVTVYGCKLGYNTPVTKQGVVVDLDPDIIVFDVNGKYVAWTPCTEKIKVTGTANTETLVKLNKHIAKLREIK